MILPNRGNGIGFVKLIIETLILMFLLFKINEAFLKRTGIAKNYKLIAKRTTLLISIIPILYILFYLGYTPIFNVLHRDE
jgi:hypothetical protein